MAVQATTPRAAPRRLRRDNLLAYVLLSLGALVVLYPFFYMVMNSVKPGPEILHSPNALPSQITF
jgi:multiple sugar transport system permease protein